MAVGSELRQVYSFAAALVACGMACTKAMGHLDGLQGTTDFCLTLAVAVLMCTATVLAGQLSGTSSSKVPSAPFPEATKNGKDHAFQDLCSGGKRGVHDSGALGQRPPEEEPSWSSTCSAKLAECFGCCMSRGDGDVDGEAPVPVKPAPAALPFADSDSIDAKLLQVASAELRSSLADLLGASGSKSPGQTDEVAVTAVQRWGGERSCLARFLRVRNLDVAAADRMFRDAVEFRRRSGANHILEDPTACKVCDTVRPFFAAEPVLFTAQGNIVIYLKMAEFLHIWRSGISEEDLRTFYISWMEKNLSLQAQGRERAGGGSDAELPACIEVYDLEGIGFKDLRCLAGLRMMMRILSIGQRFYPENLHTAIILNIPNYARPALTMIQSVLDARTREKLRFAWGNSGSAMDDILNVDPAELAKRFRAPGENL